ncbi:MAG TPA: hypothetical protein VK737_11185, partial [Opitutales bacterium]|nr:hypothetical protein [Opitutales bacterium]
MKFRLSILALPLVAFAAGLTAAHFWAAPSASAREANTTATSSNSTSPSSANSSGPVFDHAPNKKPWNADSQLGDIMRQYTGAERTLAVAALIDSLPVDQLATLINQARRCPDAGLGEKTLTMAFAKWASADPQAALAFATTAAKGVSRNGNSLGNAFATGEIVEVLGTWAATDPQAALAATKKLSTATLRSSALNSVLETMVKGPDPQSAVAYAKTLSGAQGRDALSTVFNTWATTDPAAAFAATGQISNLQMRGQMTRNAIVAEANLDPQAALAMTKSLPPGLQNMDDYSYAFSRMAMKNPSDAVAALAQMPAGYMQNLATQAVAADWADTDPQAALAWASNITNPTERQTALYYSLRHMSGSDAVGALAQINLISNANQRASATTDILSNLADTDPAAALQWVDKNTTGNTYNRTISNVLAHLSTDDPTAAVNYIATMPPGTAKNNATSTTLNLWSQQDPQAALDWANQNLTGPDLNNATNNIVRNLIATDPTSAESYVAGMPDSPARTNAIQNLANTLSRQDPNTALDWLTNTPGLPDAAKTAAMSTIMNAWAQTDPAAAAISLNQMVLKDPTYANLLPNLAAQWAAADPDSALQWAEAVTDPATRATTMNRALVTIANFDPASAWKSLAGLPADFPNTPSLMTTIINDWARQAPAAASQALNQL